MDDGKVIDFSARAIGLMRERLSALDEANACLVSNTRVHLEAVGQIHAAALALFEARSLDHFVHIVTQDWADTLNLDAVSLVLLACRPPSPRGHALPLLDPGLAHAGEAVQFVTREEGDSSALASALFGPADALIRRHAVIRLPLPGSLPAALLAFGSRESLGFDGRVGSQLLSFLGKVTAHLLARWLEPERSPA